MGNLNNLTGLFLNDNQLSGSIPSTLGNLTNLEVLNLSDNQLSGSIPSTLGNLTNLEHLYLDNNQLSGSIPSTLGNLTNLRWLRIGGSNQLTGCIPDGLRAMQNNSDLASLGLAFCGSGTTGPGTAERPDLVVESASVTNSSPDPGQSFTLSATVRNQGGSTSASTTLRYYRSSDATITTGDTQVGTDQVSGLAASGTSSESISLNAPSSSGTYYYGACVESVSGESDPNNNCSDGVRVTVTVNSAPPGGGTPNSEVEFYQLIGIPEVVVDVLTDDNLPALMRAALDGDRGAVRNLGSSTNVRDKTDDGFTVLMAAALGGDVEVMRLLYDNYRGYSWWTSLLRAETDDGFTVLMAAALGGDVEVMRFLYDNYRGYSWWTSLLRAKTKDGETALSMAIEEGHQAVVDFLRSIGATG